MAYPRFRRARTHKIVRRATGSALSLNSTAIAEVAAATNGPGTGGFDIAIPAAVGDMLQWEFQLIVGSEAVGLALDIYTMVSGSRVNPFGAGLSASHASVVGVSGWYCEGAGRNMPIVGSAFLTVQSGDISSGLVSCRPHFVTASASPRLLYATANLPAAMVLTNLGPVAN